MTPSCILLNPETKADLQAACIQAQATVDAGLNQAAATFWAGLFTLAAGLGAIAAAWMSVKAIRHQVNEAKREAAKQRDYDLKRETLLTVFYWFGDVLRSLDQLGNVAVSVQDAFALGTARTPALFSINLSCTPETVAKFFDVQEAVNKVIASLVIPATLVRLKTNDPGDEAAILWAKRCLRARTPLIKPVAKFLAAARAELDIPIDEKEYESLLRRASLSSKEISDALLDASVEARKQILRGGPPCVE